ncbi:hypothetical protein [Chitinophaga pinensis]|uniref:SH3 domain-containing protein n=1 Tax=Chitinophaga pinensis (strain ATCC 43595 / DSM 2588 / LMG 13176 / NBRC 15968 / NCIMB 11800 / UQM 2034) TaxID=485918 RepID=A0A979GW07_CHIPD|nr:hypothetical protein [Chitinophaga pinensis]ACU63768.1 hypothetical protein Cpin_6364 [Chitinophaga pinensis DSM 2588]
MKWIKDVNIFILSTLGVFLAAGCITQASSPSPTDSIMTDSAAVAIDSITATADMIAEPDSLQGEMYVIDGLIGLIAESSLQLSNASMPPVAGRDTLNATLYHENGHPVEMSYTLFEDGGAAAGIGNMYFFADYPIVSELAYGDTHIYNVLRKDSTFFSFSRNGRNYFKLITLPEGAEDLRIAHLIKDAADMLQLYPRNKIRFNVPSVPLRGDLKLLAVADVPMYEWPDSTLPSILVIPENAVLGFMGANMQEVVTDGKKWIWYEVTCGGVHGWINGHPAFVQERNDEVY